MSVAIPAAFAPAAKGITLYTLGTPNGTKISVALSLLKIPYKAYSIDISTNIQKEKWFLQNVNPNGRIPAIIDTVDGKQTRIFESGAILQYISDKYDPENKISYPQGSPLYYETLEWLFFQNAGVGPMQGQASHFAVFASEKIPYAIKRYTDETHRLYSILEEQLTKNGTGYLVGDHVSIADISTFGWVAFAYVLEIDVKSSYPLLYNWVQRIIKLPGAVDGLNTPAPWRGFSSGPWKAE